MKTLFFFAIIISMKGSAQTSVSRIYIKGGREAWTNYLQEVYLNASFKEGIVEYKNGKRYKSQLNYNRALGAIQFIDEKNDTLALANETDIRMVTIGDAKFYTDPVAMMRVAGNEKFVLARNEKIKVADKQKVGAFGIPNSAGTIDSYDRTYSRNNDRIDIDEELLLRKTSAYFIGSAERGMNPATKKNILALFPESEEGIRKFMADNATDINKDADLLKLAEFLENL